MKAKKVLAAILAAAMTLSMAACGGSSSSEAPATESTAETVGTAAPEPGEKDAEQYVSTYMDAEPTTLDPSLRSDSYSSDILINVMEGLIRLEQRDGEYVFMPGDA
ncbi:MAG: peptide ABC transporter substrate-binding protein, partial [Dorea sp.]|nr:peptide ABC transporter substrate-binding protein [Dorea sp.]